MSALTAFERFKERIIGHVDAQRSRCWLLHQWTTWRDISSGKIVTTDDNRVMGTFNIQERRCSRCNMADQRHIKQRIV